MDRSVDGAVCARKPLVRPLRDWTSRRPEDLFEWKKCDIEMKDHRSSKVIYSLQGGEFPDAWSHLACQITSSKYFRRRIDGHEDAPKSETSIKQLVRRVTDTIADWGLQDGYFEDQEERDQFADDLAFLMYDQQAAFNSPVWFNVGLHHTYGCTSAGSGHWRWDEELDDVVECEDGLKNPQASACYLLAMNDTIESISDRSRIEMRLFKYGSGIGCNNSKMRSMRETISGGGRPSGPLSFMEVYDVVAKTTKSGGVNRRAAKMEILNADHPDILEFIRVKSKEEAKAYALIREGYEADFNGEAYTTVKFQNSNMSVMGTDAFYSAAEANYAETGRSLNWQTLAVTTGTGYNQVGEAMPRYAAGDLLDEIASSTWNCGDPGCFYYDAIQFWHTAPSYGPITTSNPCGEYLHVDDSACNLASLNLMRFKDNDGRFNILAFRRAVELIITAQEILVDRAGYPEKKIAKHSHELRPLGIGYANLGSLLMSYGVPYDSTVGRGIAASIVGLMTGYAYQQSATIAERMGPFEGYEANKAAVKRVVDQHESAANHLDGIPNAVDFTNGKGALRGLFAAMEESKKQINLLLFGSYEGHCSVAWQQARQMVAEHGCRNSQLSLCAPTGTISFMMDCDTTGIEPELALVKYKTLAGGGKLKLVNTRVQEALKNLGYDANETADIVDYISEHETIEGSKLKESHLPVFDCAFVAGKGTRSIDTMGHVRMLAATQPFISGSSSKTNNCPSSYTVEDIRNIYLAAWKLGLKNIAIYRDNSKLSQPLNTKKEEKSPSTPGNSPQLPATPAPLQRRPPRRRASQTTKFSVGGYKGWMTVGLYEDGSPCELFVSMNNDGSTFGGMMDVFAKGISNMLQYGVPLADVVNKLAYDRFEPSGLTDDPEIPFAPSMPAYIVRRMALDYLGEDGKQFGNGEAYKGREDILQPSKDRHPEVIKLQAPPSGEACGKCGALMTKRAGKCFVCDNCGTQGGCG
jgi:ribonucleoside-diphosphate reductase alpha chain